MPVYFFWGDDDYRLQQAVQSLEAKVLDPAWKSFNADAVDGKSAAIEALVQCLNQAVTPPFGMGDRFIQIANPPLGGQDGTLFASELERTLPVLPPTSHLVITYSGKPDGRSKVTKLLNQQAKTQEFAVVPPWKTDQIRKTVQQTAQQFKVAFTDDALDLLAEAVGNDTRQLHNELEKLNLFAASTPQPQHPLEASTIRVLVNASQQNALELATVIRQGKCDRALQLVDDLLRHNEPALRISATLIRQFRTWLWIKLMQQSGERDERVIAQAAEVGNPKRVYFLVKEVQHLTPAQLQQTLSLLLDLEFQLKSGHDPRMTLQTKAIELCQVCLTRQVD